MIGKSIEKITLGDIQALVDNAVVEGKTIEYKRSLPGNTDSEKKEFLADVCFDSIWNACGFPRSINYNDAGEWAP